MPLRLVGNPHPRWTRLAATGAAVAACTVALAQSGIGTRMSFPAGFPEDFVLYDRDEDDAKATVQLRYANRIARDAARAGLELPAGSVLIAANHTVAVDPGTGKPQRDSAGRLVAGAVQSYAGMEARNGWSETVPAGLRNGQWHYALFSAERRRSESFDQADCLRCHLPKAKDSYVFTIKALREAAQRP
jgi:hypothetical protein